MTLLNKKNIFHIIILLVVSILTIVWVNVNAETINLPLEPIRPLNPSFRTDIVGITLSKSSILLVKTNYTNIPSYEKLVEMGYDKSKSISGKFIFKNGYFQRDNTKVNNELIYYLNEKNLTIVDPSIKLSKKIKMIIIEPSLNSYVLQKDMNKIDNKRTIYKERFVNDICTIATISSHNLLITLPDTISYLQNNCVDELDGIKIIIIDNATKTDITTSQKYKEDKFKQQVKSDYKTVSKIGSNDKTVNKSVTEDKHQKYKPKVIPPFNYTKYR